MEKGEWIGGGGGWQIAIRIIWEDMRRRRKKTEMTVAAGGLGVTSEGFRGRERENEEPLRLENRRARHSGAGGGVTIPAYIHIREEKAA